MHKPNYWVWSHIAESKYADRKEGYPVPLGYLTEGFSDYYPRQAWIQKGYVIRKFV